MLFTDNFYSDIHGPNVCEKVKHGDVKVKEIKVKMDGDEKLFYYNDDDASNIKLFMFSEPLQQYISMQSDHPLYGELMKQIISFL
jgi:hypothetical protein